MSDDAVSQFRLPGGLRLQAGEGRLLLLMIALVACLLAGYTVAKVLRDSMFISTYGALSLPFGYVLVVLASILIVTIEPRLTRRMSRSNAAAVAQGIAIFASAGAAIVFPFAGPWLAGAFYVWAGSQAIMVIPYFWVVALEVWDPRRARDVFPLLSAAGLLGGVVGGAFATWGAHRLGTQGLLWALTALLLLARVISLTLDKQLPSRPFASQTDVGKSRLGIVLESPYLRLLGLTLALSVMASTLVDFQFKYAAQRSFRDPEALTRFLGLFYAGLNALALVMQVGVAGWLLKRLGLFASSAVQPLTVLAFSGTLVLFPRWGIILAFRWVQGVIAQTLGKSASELYFQAVRASERERVKPGLDTLVERGADGLVGLLLIVALHFFGMRIVAAAAVTALVALAWLVSVVLLRRDYVRAFRQSLAGPAPESALAQAIPRDAATRRTLISALESSDERQVELALRIASHVRNREVIEAVRACLVRSESPGVRAAAIRTLASLRVPDTSGIVEASLGEGDERLRRAAVEHVLALARDPAAVGRELLDRPDRALRTLVLENLLEHRRATVRRGVVTLAWIDRRLEGGSTEHASEDAIHTALALALVPGRAASERLRRLLESDDVEVRRAALRAAAARPDLSLLPPIVAALDDRALTAEAREAVAAIGDGAVPALRRVALEGVGHARLAACQALARLGSRRAANVLLEITRSQDPEARYDGLRNLNRIRQRTTGRLVPRSLAHRMFLREMADYRMHLHPAIALEGAVEPTTKLLQASYEESADRALERACRSLACAYNPAPFRAIYAHLSDSPASKNAAQALEYLSHMLPRKVFQSARRVLDEGVESAEANANANAEANAGADATAETAGGREASPTGPDESKIRRAVELAWRTGDDWLRACAAAVVRALPSLGIRLEPRADESPRVLAELIGEGTVAREANTGSSAC
jgi:ATP/ADP translocase/HEAT repeat protein